MTENRQSGKVRNAVIPMTGIVSILFFLSALSFAQTDDQPNDSPAAIDDTTLSSTTPVAPVTSLIATDHKYDDGDAIELTWVPSIDDQLLDGKVVGYEVNRLNVDGVLEVATELPPGSNSYLDVSVELGQGYRYSVTTVAADSRTESVITEIVFSKRDWINFDLKYLFLIAFIITAAIIYFVETARRGKKLFSESNHRTTVKCCVGAVFHSA
ncbi:MAG: hypothetical protein IH991_03245 [Planctomycetes bacterium]|nr:hypothetical protein [Planctomycetota bacterium]